MSDHNDRKGSMKRLPCSALSGVSGDMTFTLRAQDSEVFHFIA